MHETENEEGGAVRLSRREVLRFFAGAGAMMAAGDSLSLGVPGAPAAQGYGSDPDLLRIYKPGDVWPLTMSAEQKAAATALADVILPEDELGPAASALRVPDFIDEWVSAPYPNQQAVRGTIMDGLVWLDGEARKRHGKPFAALEAAQQTALCDAICDLEKAGPEYQAAAQFFRSFRGLAMGAYFCTPEGWKAIGYVGNVPLASYDGPPPEVLEKLGVEQTVK
jgi:hypothetical protein